MSVYACAWFVCLCVYMYVCVLMSVYAVRELCVCCAFVGICVL